MSKTQKIEVQGLVFETPPIPKKSQIYLSDLPKKEQYWRRRDLPNSLDGMTSEEADAFIMQEWNYIINGFWYMNNGVANFVTGINYFFLQHYLLQHGEYGDYRETDRDFFYFWDLLENNKKAIGVIALKFRRRGLSSIATCIALYIALTENNKHCGLISKDGETVRDGLFKEMVMNAYVKMPEWLKPRNSGTDRSAKELIFLKQAERISKNNKGNKTENVGLNNKITYRNTSMNAYDGQNLRYLVIDECFGEGTKILMNDFSFKNIEEIVIGDKVIVEGGKEIEVASTCSGEDDLFLVKQKYSQDYVVNSKHRLYVDERSGRTDRHSLNDGIKTITPVEYLELDSYRRRTTYGIKSFGLEFPKKELPLDPYFLGVWLGDGSQENASVIINMEEDQCILDYLIKFASDNEMDYSLTKTTSKKCKVISIIRPDQSLNGRVYTNKILDSIKSLGLYKNKHIPNSYLTSSTEDRLQLLAGIIDTDGYLCFKSNSYHFQIAMSREDMIDQIYALVSSLGFKCSNVKRKKTNLNTLAYKFSFYGDLSKIPTKVQRKQVPSSYKRTYASHITNIDIEPIGKGKYHGITLKTENDEDRRLILEDFTISMNCGKWKSEVPIERYYPIAKKCALKGAKRVGMLFLLSTANELESGGRGFKELWKRSDHNAGGDGITQSGLYRFFMPAWMGFHGYFNLYGQPIIDTPTPEEAAYLKEKGEVLYPEIGSREYLQMERDKLKDSPDDLSDEMRMNPFTPDEAFFEKSTNCIINPLIANQQIDWNDNNIIPRRQCKFYRDYSDGRVKIMNTPEGMWTLLWDFDNESQSNNNKIIYGKKRPQNTHFFGIGIDPYASSEGSAYSSPSKGIAYIKRFFNPLDPDTSDCGIARMDYRPKLKSMFFEQIFLAAEYFGAMANFEQTVSDFYDYAMENGYEHFLIYTPVELQGAQSKMQKAGTPATSKKSIEFHTNMIVKDFNDNHHKYYFNELLRDLIPFDPSDRTIYDDSMAWGYVCIAQHVCTARPIVPEKTERKALVKRYSLQR